MHTTSIKNKGTIKQYTADSQTSFYLSLIFLISSGTGAACNVDTYKQWGDTYKRTGTPFTVNTIVPDKPATTPAIDIRNIAQHLANIRNVLAPSMSELAKDLAITRQALYKWLSGENQPDDPAKTQFITNLSNIADSFSKAGFNDARLLLKMKAFNGKSLLDLIKRGEDWHKPVQILIEEAKAMTAAANSVNTSKAQPTDGWKSSVSVPGTIGD